MSIHRALLNMTVILVMIVLVNSINPLSVMSEAENVQSIAVDEGYKAAKAVGKLGESIRPGKREVQGPLKRVVAINGSLVSRTLTLKRASSE
ncbi:hypothetical protein BGW37DRAFT_489391 [Umbelopsis sp. PMI_123]|nr:hypothetical protein BGW37DRAFT_489391 [Umbelopsis sp. PMI_123]